MNSSKVVKYILITIVVGLFAICYVFATHINRHGWHLAMREFYLESERNPQDSLDDLNTKNQYAVLKSFKLTTGTLSNGTPILLFKGDNRELILFRRNGRIVYLNAK